MLTITNNGVSEKLVFPPSQHLKPPKYQRRRRKYISRRQFNPRMSYYEPRPFDFPLNGQPPSSFQKISTPPPLVPVANGKRVNSIQDILNQGEVIQHSPHDQSLSPSIHGSPGNRIEIIGTYRHPKEYGDVMRMLKRAPTPSYDLTPSASTSAQPTFLPKPPTTLATSSTAETFKGDPFYNYKPKSPSDINLMALNQFRFALPPNPNLPTIHPTHKNSFIPMFAPNKYHPLKYSMTSQRPYATGNDAENLYQEIVNSSREAGATMGEIMRIGNGASGPLKKKPFSLMLDIYPMSTDEEPTTRRPRQMGRPASFSILPNHSTINSMHMVHPNDHSYYTSMHFPQIQPSRFPQPNFYNFNPVSPHHRNHGSSGLAKHQHAAVDKPGQMVVHLNLYPKNRAKKQRNVEILEDRSLEESIEHIPESERRSNERVSDLFMEEQELINMTTTKLNTGEVYITPTMTELETQLMRLPIFNLSTTPYNHTTTSYNHTTSQWKNETESHRSTAGIKFDNHFEIQRSVEIPTNISFESVDLSNYTTPFNLFSQRNINHSQTQYYIDDHSQSQNILNHSKNNSSTEEIPYLLNTRSDINELISKKLTENGDSKYFNIDDDYAEEDVPSNGRNGVDGFNEPATEISDKMDGFQNELETSGNQQVVDKRLNHKNFTVPVVQFVRFKAEDGMGMHSVRNIFSELNTNEKI